MATVDADGYPFDPVELENQGLGRCDQCGKVLPIDRGDNFYWCETHSRWECEDCSCEE